MGKVDIHSASSGGKSASGTKESKTPPGKPIVSDVKRTAWRLLAHCHTRNRLEILGYMNAYIQTIIDQGILPLPSVQSKSVANIQELDDILVTMDRILNTPLPIAYTIAISQITRIYVVVLPFQRVSKLGLANVPATIIAAYIILSFAAIGNEIENPIGREVNELPLELYCGQFATEVAIFAARPPPELDDCASHLGIIPLYPIRSAGPECWPDIGIKDIRGALKMRANVDEAGHVEETDSCNSENARRKISVY